MRLGATLATALLLARAACASPAGVASDVAGWAAARGGFVGGPAQERADRVARSLAAAPGMPALRVRVLDSPEVGAFSWPGGEVVVTAALLDLLADDELTAALAHEAGHLLAAAGHEPGARLVGAAADDGVAAADAVGVWLLEAASDDPTAMVRMLHTLRAALASDARVAAAIDRRIARLERAR